MTVNKSDGSVSCALNKKQRIIIISIAVFLALAIVGTVLIGYFGGWFDSVNSKPYDAAVIKKEDLSIHFLELGNKFKGECIYIKAGETDVLIDAGNRRNTSTTIANYINQYVTDGKLEFVIVSHPHRDHISGLVGSNANPGLFETYEIGTIIDFAKTNLQTVNDKGEKTLYGSYLEKRDAAVARGAKHYTAAECYSNSNGASSKYQLSETVELEVLYNYYYYNDSTVDNNYSVCLMINQKVNGAKTNHYFFSGDMHKEGEEKLVEYYGDALPHCVLYNAAHHGSKTSSSPEFMAKISPEYVCVSCCAGTSQSGDVKANQPPMQAFINNVAPYTDKVYVTTQVDTYCERSDWASKGTVKSMNGNIVFACSKGKVTMYFSNNDTKLKDTDWFKENRECPDEWKTT